LVGLTFNNERMARRTSLPRSRYCSTMLE
jgi:hypothetical protein